MSRHLDWLRQAENDLAWAAYSMDGGFYAQVCFVAQQAAEKALKAYCFTKGFDVVRTHSLFELVRALGEDGALENSAKALDLYYISSRYPDAFPAGAPFELIGEAQAEQALREARDIFEAMRKRIKGDGRS